MILTVLCQGIIIKSQLIMNTIYITSANTAMYIGLNDDREWIWRKNINNALRFGTKFDAMQFIDKNIVLKESYEENGLWILG